VLDRITAAAAEMTVAARLTAGTTDIFSDINQVDLGDGQARFGQRFFVAAGRVMAHKAVDTRWIREVEGVILPTVSRMT
jgi:hypothetical protein